MAIEHKLRGFDLGGEPDLFWSIADPVSLSAAEFLTGTDLAGVRQYVAEPCGWFFLVPASREREFGAKRELREPIEGTKSLRSTTKADSKKVA